ncbi:MAG: hypothetical protein R2730_00905 [Chitinophagales bacterium]
MKKFVAAIFLLCFTIVMWAGNTYEHNDPPVTKIERIEQERPISPCVKTLLDGEEINNENLKKSSEGTLQVKTEENKVYFNLVLKSYVGSEKPPLYLRFTKVDRLDIQKVLKYAKIGDEIFIEPFTIDGFKCLPSHFIVT